MPVPRVAVVGRPNVGKSSLVNMIAQERISIVDAAPGVTRDRVSTIVELVGPGGEGPIKPIELTDTGGFGVYVAEGARFDDVGADLSTLTKDIERQIAAAVGSADLILFALDVQAGITPQDLEIARMLREQRLGRRERTGGELAPVRVVATKVDSQSWETHAYELSGLGFGEPLMCSAKTKYMRRSMLEELYEIVPLWSETPGAEDETEAGVRIAIVGKRNSGKSTLVNTLAGEPRVIVSEIAGTTRDAIDVRITLADGRKITAIDTAGLRRKKSFQDQVEWYAFDRAQRAIARADVVLLMIDATSDISQVDEQLAALIVKSYKPVVAVINKWDLVEGLIGPKGTPIGTQDYEEYVRRELKALDFAPIAFMSASEGRNVKPVVNLAFSLREQAGARISTGEMNRVMREIVHRHHPASIQGRQGKMFFAAQVKANPPTIVMIVNRTEIFGSSYERYIMNRLRELTPFEEVPIRLIFRSRKRAEQAAIESGKLRKADVRQGQLHTTDPMTQDFVDDIDYEALLGADAGVDLADLPEDPSAYFDDEG